MKKQKQIRLRRRRRGAAAVEGAMTATLFVLIFGGLYSSVGYFSMKVNVMGEARKTAWSQALDPCGGSGIFGTVKDQMIGDGASSSGSSSDTKYAGLSNDAEADSGYISIQATGSFTNAGLIGGGSYSLSNRMHIRCNEDVQNDTLWDLIKAAMGAISPF